jgi:hypothetical protein
VVSIIEDFSILQGDKIDTKDLQIWKIWYTIHDLERGSVKNLG